MIYTSNRITLSLKKEILTHAITWMNPEGIMLSEISQLQKDKYCRIPLLRSTWYSQIQRQEVEWGLSEAGGG